MVKEAGDGAVIQQPETGSADYAVPVTIKVLDSEDVAVEGFHTRFTAFRGRERLGDGDPVRAAE